jgi:hypothetical protein
MRNKRRQKYVRDKGKDERGKGMVGQMKESERNTGKRTGREKVQNE